MVFLIGCCKINNNRDLVCFLENLLRNRHETQIMKHIEPVSWPLLHVPWRTEATGCWTALWGGGCLRENSSSQILLCSKCCFGWFSLVCLQNWSLACPSSSSPSSTGSMKDSVAQRPVSLENSALILSSIQTVSLCWVLSLQSSWRERWVTDLWQTDEMLGTFVSNNQLFLSF